MRLLVILAGVLATLTSAAPAAPAPVSHDMCTVPAGWTTPFTRVYHLRNGATVVFVGVEHTQDLGDATHRQIEAAFRRYKPGFVLVEGTSSAKSAFDWYQRDMVALAKARTDAGSAAETLYAVQLASSTGTPFSGWDFSPDQDYRVLVGDGFAISDALGAHLLRSHVDPFGGERVAREVERQVRYAAMVMPVAGFDYAAWYRQAYGEQVDLANGTPCGGGIGGRIVSDLSYRRNLNLAGLIESHALPGRTVLVEAGANHWLAMRDWLLSRSASED